MLRVGCRYGTPLLFGLLLAVASSISSGRYRVLMADEPYPIVDTGQVRCYDDRVEIAYPKPGERFFGQDAQYRGHTPSYRDNGDGTITDLVTGLMWQKDPGEKKTYAEAVAGAAECRLGGYDDWRLPTIKELYSLILFSGEDVDPMATGGDLHPFIADCFAFQYGDVQKGERIIDSQFATATEYTSTTMNGAATVFGVNFADGRIKGYPRDRGPRGPKMFYVLYCRGNPDYGKNDFHDNGDGTITDRATGLMWAKIDSGHLKAGPNKDGRMNWEQALKWVEDLEYAGYDDWRLPNAKELQSLVDYTRSPDATNSPAIDPLFECTPIRDPLGRVDYGFYWTSTTHKRQGDGSAAVYIAFGRGGGWMPDRTGTYRYLDVHGAGCQRSDPKSGDPSRFPHGRGPQGDVIGIYNFVRPVRGGKAEPATEGPPLEEVKPRSRRPGAEAGFAPGPMPGGRPGGGIGPGIAPGFDPRGFGPPPGAPMPRGNAQPMPPSNPQAFLERLDRNGDGVISRDEFRGPPAAFGRFDADGDGSLDADEIRALLESRRTRGEAPQGPVSPGRRAVPLRAPAAAENPAKRRETAEASNAASVAKTPSGETPAPRTEATFASLAREIDATAPLPKKPSPDTPPNFVFVLIDDLGW
ncbi:MAG: DUF1566 domain-containing protein, partial [Planctomycetota bacterium]